MRSEHIRNWATTLASVFIAVMTGASYLLPLQPMMAPVAVTQSADVR